MSEKIYAGGLWENKTKDGKTFLSGKLGVVKVLVFRNDRKTSDNSPDWQMYFAESERLPQAGGQGGGQASGWSPGDHGDTEIPF